MNGRFTQKTLHSLLESIDILLITSQINSTIDGCYAFTQITFITNFRNVRKTGCCYVSKLKSQSNLFCELIKLLVPCKLNIFNQTEALVSSLWYLIKQELFCRCFILLLLRTHSLTSTSFALQNSSIYIQGVSKLGRAKVYSLSKN